MSEIVLCYRCKSGMLEDCKARSNWLIEDETSTRSKCPSCCNLNLNQSKNFFNAHERIARATRRRTVETRINSGGCDNCPSLVKCVTLEVV